MNQQLEGGFLTGDNLLELESIFIPVVRNGKTLIPVGPHTLYLGGVDVVKNEKQNCPMFVLTIRKNRIKVPDTEDQYYTFEPITEYAIVNFSDKTQCDAKGVPYGLTKIRSFFKTCFNLEFEGLKTNDPFKLCEHFADQMRNGCSRKSVFNAIVCHEIHVLQYEELGIAKMTETGKPVLSHFVRLYKAGPTGIDLPVPESYDVLLRDLNEEDHFLIKKARKYFNFND